MTPERLERVRQAGFELGKASPLTLEQRAGVVAAVKLHRVERRAA